MSYRGRVQNGVVILEGAAALQEGTLVDVIPLVPEEAPKRGSAEAIMRNAGIWAEVVDEVDGQLAELRQMKRDELARAKQSGTFDDGPGRR